jgi:hypothetical protein
MGIFKLGDQRVGIERDVPVLDGDGKQTYTDANEPIYEPEPSVIWVDDALFETEIGTEQQGLTVTTAAISRAFLPISADLIIPAVDDSDVAAPLPFFDADGKPNISSSARLISDGLRYVMRDDAVLERDTRGRADHVHCFCERQQG